jgi:hypothetical protein
MSLLDMSNASRPPILVDREIMSTAFTKGRGSSPQMEFSSAYGETVD